MTLEASLSMKLSMIAIEKGGLILVATDGNITAADVDPTGKNPLEAMLGVTWSSNKVLINCEKTNYIDSSAIGWIMGTYKSFKEGGGSVVLYNVQQGMKQILDVLKIGRVVPIAKDEAHARQLVTGGAQ
jgi:anti-anti-sigma factor